MGLYLRRSIRVGPLRFNFSTSGIGVSAGIPGLRVGTGPRGAYVHMGRGGLYYRQSLGGASSARRSRIPVSPAQGRPPQISDSSVAPMEEIESASVLQMADSSSQALLENIRQRQATPRIAPWVFGGTALVLLVAWGNNLRGMPILALLALGVAGYWWTSARDAIRRTVVVGYDLDPDAANSFEALVAAIKGLGETGGLWHVQAKGEVRDRKYQAGASSVIKRSAVRPTFGEPPIIRANLDIPSLSVGRQRLCFFPDRLLVYEGRNVGAVAYHDLAVEVGTTRFVEEQGVPNDAQVVDRTWRYVNKGGGPDRRFRDNRELPVVLYETIQLRSSTGLNELLHVSRQGAGAAIASAVAQIAGLSAGGADVRG